MPIRQGMQSGLMKGVFKGRIYVPANHSIGNPQPGFNEYNAYGYFSDDHGKVGK